MTTPEQDRVQKKIDKLEGKRSLVLAKLEACENLDPGDPAKRSAGLLKLKLANIEEALSRLYFRLETER